MFNKWQLTLNINKCKIVSYSRKSIDVNDYFLDTTILKHATSISDLAVKFDQKLNFSLHINEKINKANSI
jgi:hypothetical protein